MCVRVAFPVCQYSSFCSTGFLCREYKKIQLSLVPRTVPVVMKTLHRAEKLLKDELPEGDKSLGVLRGRRDEGEGRLRLGGSHKKKSNPPDSSTFFSHLDIIPVWM